MNQSSLCCLDIKGKTVLPCHILYKNLLCIVYCICIYILFKKKSIEKRKYGMTFYGIVKFKIENYEKHLC